MLHFKLKSAPSPYKPQMQLAWLARSTAIGLLEAINHAADDGLLVAPPTLLRGDLDTLRSRPLRVAMLNHAASYYLHRDKEVGFQYDMAALLAARLGMRIEVVVPRQGTDPMQLVADGTVDVAPIAGTLNNPNVLLSNPFSYTDHLLVQPAGEPPITQLDKLRGKTLTVRGGSPYYSMLKALEPTARMHAVVGPDDQDTEELIDAVGQHKLPYTVSSSLLLGIELAKRQVVQGTLVFSHQQPTVYGVRRDAPLLLRRLNAAIGQMIGSAPYQAIYARYLGTAHAPPPSSQAANPRQAIFLSPESRRNELPTCRVGITASARYSAPRCQSWDVIMMNFSGRSPERHQRLLLRQLHGPWRLAQEPIDGALTITLRVAVHHVASHALGETSAHAARLVAMLV